MGDDWNGPDFADETLPVLRPRRAERKAPEAHPMDIAGQTDVGCARDHNEDTFLIADLGRWLEVRDGSLSMPEAQRRIPGPKGTFLMVADGMGGHGGGEVASAVAVDMIAQFALYAMPWVTAPSDEDEKELCEQLGNALSQCQSRLEKVAARKEIDQLNPGTTLTVGYVLWPKLYVSHAGDSRLYLQRGDRLVQITRDHTVGQALRESGAIPAGPSRFDHILVNVVGGGGERVDAEAHALTLEPGDRVLLCSDGLNGHVADATILHELRTAHTSREVCERLIEAAKAGGGLDNITVVVASF